MKAKIKTGLKSNEKGLKPKCLFVPMAPTEAYQCKSECWRHFVIILPVHTESQNL